MFETADLRALDLLVAENIMGFIPTVVCPRYSTTLPDAWQVVERMAELGWSVEISRNPDAQYRVVFWTMPEDGPPLVSAQEDSLPLAVCRAALDCPKYADARS